MQEMKMRDDCKEALIAYRDWGRPLGGFLTAVVCNDLVEAAAHADEYNIRNLPAYAEFLYWELPIGSWGSSEIVEKWIEKGGLYGGRESADK